MASMWQSVSPRTNQCACSLEQSSACGSISSPKCPCPALRKMTMRFVARVLSNSSYIPAKGRAASFSDIRYTVGNPGLHSSSLLLDGLPFAPSQFRRNDFGVIECGDDVPMAAQVSTKKRRLSPPVSAAMRKEDQRVESGLGSGIAHSQL